MYILKPIFIYYLDDIHLYGFLYLINLFYYSHIDTFLISNFENIISLNTNKLGLSETSMNVDSNNYRITSTLKEFGLYNWDFVKCLSLRPYFNYLGIKYFFTYRVGKCSDKIGRASCRERV